MIVVDVYSISPEPLTLLTATVTFLSRLPIAGGGNSHRISTVTCVVFSEQTRARATVGAPVLGISRHAKVVSPFPTFARYDNADDGSLVP